MDQINPRVLSNNMLVPYIIAIWEEYFRSTFKAVLKYSKERSRALKRVKLNHAHLEFALQDSKSIEGGIADCFSFQRPAHISENFRMIDPNLDIAGAMRRPYRRRKQSLYDSIEDLVSKRNEFVHSGQMDLSLFDKKANKIMEDIEEAADRTYQEIGRHFNFKLIRDY